MSKPVFHGEITLADSSVIQAVKYDVNNNILDVKLQSGKAYRYRDISSWDFSNLVTAKSAGAVYNNNIKRSWTGDPRKATSLRTW